MKKIYLLLIPIVFAACKKNDVSGTVIADGTYSGTFVYGNTNPAVNYAPLTGQVTLTMKNQAYTCTSPLTTFGAAARGSFAVAEPQIIFRDSTIHTANFDGNVVLNGTYNATVKGDSLYLVKTANTFSTYTYKLKKQ